LERIGCEISDVVGVEEDDEGDDDDDDVEEASALEEAPLTAAIPGGGPRIPAPAVCEKLIFLTAIFQALWLLRGDDERGRKGNWNKDVIRSIHHRR